MRTTKTLAENTSGGWMLSAFLMSICLAIVHAPPPDFHLYDRFSCVSFALRRLACRVCCSAKAWRPRRPQPRVRHELVFPDAHSRPLRRIEARSISRVLPSSRPMDVQQRNGNRNTDMRSKGGEDLRVSVLAC